MAFMGETTDVGVAELLSVLARRKHSGRLHINATGDEVQVTLESGKVTQVSSSHHSLRLGRVLVRQGVLTETDLDNAVRDQTSGQSGRPLGQILISKGLATQSDLARAAQEQATEALARVFGARHGTFFFTSDPSAESRGGLVELNAEGIVLEASRRADELATLRKIAPDDERVLALDRSRLPLNGRLPLHEQRVVRILARQPMSMRDLVSELNDDENACLRAVVGLKERGLISTGSDSVTPTVRTAEPLIDPRSIAQIKALVEAGSSSAGRQWAPSINEVRAAVQAGTQTTAQITRVVRDVVAAFNAGLPLLAFAYFTDDYFRRMSSVSDEEFEFILQEAQPLTEDEHQTFIDLRDARTLADGRVSAIVVTSLPGAGESKKVVIFAETGEQQCQIDAIIESAHERERHTQTTMLSQTGLLTTDIRMLRKYL